MSPVSERAGEPAETGLPARRRGVCQGNFAEELLAADAAGRPGYLLDRGAAFDGTTTSRAAFTPDGQAVQAQECMPFSLDGAIAA